MKKKILTSLIIATISLSSSITVFAQGYKGQGYRVGRYTPPTEHKSSFGDIYKGVGPASFELHGWQDINGKTFYFDEDGKRVKGLIKIDGKLYYFNDFGELQLGLTYLNIPCRGYEIYYFDRDTGAVTNKWETVKGKKYYFDSEGLAYNDEVEKIDGKLYAFNSDGSLNTTTTGIAVLRSKLPDGTSKNYYTYCLEKGVVKTGWQLPNVDGDDPDDFHKLVYDNQYYSPETGALVHGWKTINGKTYFFRSAPDVKSDGTMVRGIQTIDGKVYDFGYDGVLKGEVSK